jgi:hypothetical protein
MSLSRSDALRILRFCLGSDDSGDADVRPDGTRVVTIALCRATVEVRAFEADTFEEALRRAGAAGVLKEACVQKQIAFLARRAPAEDQAGPGVPFLDIAEAVGAILHETQRERGMSALFVGSDGRLFRDELAEQWRKTDQRRALLDAVDSRLVGPSALPAVRRRAQNARALLDAVGPLRARVEQRAVEIPRLIEVYSDLNGELLSAVEAFMVVGVLGAGRSGAIACVSLLHAKEKVGIERAQLGSAFAVDRLDAAQRLSLAALLAAQSSYLHIFSAAAPPLAEQLLRRGMASPAAEEVQRMESVVFADTDRGFGIDPATWFATITRKIEMLREVTSSTITLMRAHSRPECA